MRRQGSRRPLFGGLLPLRKCRCELLQTARSDGGAKVVAVGCLAERYGTELAESLPEADAVLGFDDYPDTAARLRSVLAGEQQHPHTPQDRRRLLSISPAERDASAVVVPGHTISAPDLPPGAAPDSGPRAVRRRRSGRSAGSRRTGVCRRAPITI